MNKRHLLEAASLVSESSAEDGTWEVRLISEGQGSSGIYTRELLENHHKALDDSLSFRNHPTGWDGPQSRDFTMIAGQVVGETWLAEDERGLLAVHGKYLPDPEYRDKIERYKDKLGLSIYIEGSGYENDNGDFVVDWLNPQDPYKSIDVVIAPGARGKFMESMKQVYSTTVEKENPGARQVNENKETGMEKEILEQLKAVNEALTKLATDKVATEAAEAQVEADQTAVTSAVEAYDAAVKLIDEADLLDVQVEALRKAAKEGKDIEPLIAEAKAVKEAAEKSVKESQGSGSGGRILGETATKFGAWA